MEWALVENYLNLGVFNVKTSMIYFYIYFCYSLGGFNVKPSVNCYLHFAFTTQYAPTQGLVFIKISGVLMLNRL